MLQKRAKRERRREKGRTQLGVPVTHWKRDPGSIPDVKDAATLTSKSQNYVFQQCQINAKIVHWCPFRNESELLWNCSETALKLLWNCSEIALKLLWNCSETALKLLWRGMPSGLMIGSNFPRIHRFPGSFDRYFIRIASAYFQHVLHWAIRRLSYVLYCTLFYFKSVPVWGASRSSITFK